MKNFMKNKIKLTAGIKLINKKFRKNEHYHYFSEPNNALIIPIINNKFLIVEQKRVPINKKNYEFPMGWIDKKEKPYQSASRELLEKTGYKTLTKPKNLLIFHPDPGRNSRSVFCYYTKKIKKIKKPEKNINILFKNKKQILNFIKLKKFNNATHLAAFYCYINKF